MMDYLRLPTFVLSSVSSTKGHILRLYPRVYHHFDHRNRLRVTVSDSRVTQKNRKGYIHNVQLSQPWVSFAEETRDFDGPVR